MEFFWGNKFLMEFLRGHVSILMEFFWVNNSQMISCGVRTFLMCFLRGKSE